MKVSFHTSLIWAISFLMAACGGKKEDTGQNTGKLYIVATTGMIKDAVVHIAGEYADVDGLMGPGVDPHLYRATPTDLQRLRKADIVFYNGLHLEGNMIEVLEKLGRQQKVFAVADGIPHDRLINFNAQTHDPHIWFDVSIWMEAVKQVGKKLAEVDPAHADIYQERLADYLSELQQAHEKAKEEIATIPIESRVLVTAHDAFTYFGRAYNIEVRGLQGISTLSEFGLKDISALVNFISERKVKAVFVESSVPPKSLEAVVSGCEGKGHHVKIGGTLFSDAMGADNTPEGSYLGMFQYNVKAIVNSLK